MSREDRDITCSKITCGEVRSCQSDKNNEPFEKSQKTS